MYLPKKEEKKDKKLIINHHSSLPGIISRQEAEDLLSEKGPGYFLIRVSERILGYVLSHCSQEGCKHFLIDATDNCYMLLGDQLSFSSLVELVEYHEVQ